MAFSTIRILERGYETLQHQISDTVETGAKISYIRSYLKTMCVCICAIVGSQVSSQETFQTHGVHVVQSFVLPHLWSWSDYVVMTVNQRQGSLCVWIPRPEGRIILSEEILPECLATLVPSLDVKSYLSLCFISHTVSKA